MTEMAYGTIPHRDGEPVLPKWWRTIDRWSLSAILLLFGIGILLGLAASPPLAERNGLAPFYYVARQAQFGTLALMIWAVLALVAAIGAFAFSRRIRKLVRLDQVLRRLDEKIKATLTVSVDFTSGSTTEVRRSPYPFSALQQLVRNAVMHRTYEATNAPVRVMWFDDRIEIINPGGPFGLVTQENFGRPGVSDYRNPAIAGVLKTLGYVQRFGFGIAEARRALEANGNPPLEFQIEPTVVMATLRAAP